MNADREADLRFHHALAYGGGCAVSAVFIRLWPDVWWAVLAVGLVIAAYGIYRYATGASPT